MIGFDAGIPLTSFAVEDVRAEHERLKGRGVTFRQVPKQAGPAVIASFEDTCGPVIRIHQV